MSSSHRPHLGEAGGSTLGGSMVVRLLASGDSSALRARVLWQRHGEPMHVAGPVLLDDEASVVALVVESTMALYQDVADAILEQQE